MNSKKINGYDFFYYESDDPVVAYLKQDQLFGANNYFLLNSFILDNNSDGYIIDCGSHIGTFSFFPAINKKNVLMIDGASRNIECLKKTFHNMSNIIIEQAILLDKQQKCNFSSDYGPFGSASSSDDGSQISDTLDNIIHKNNITNIIGIKIDVEGNECEVIRGAINTINKFLPPIVLEINGYALLKHEKTPQQLFKLIDDIGYIPFLPHQQGLIPLFLSDKFPFCVEDVICIHKNNIFKYIGMYSIINRLPETKINEILENNKKTGNNECQEYYNSII